MYVIYDTKTPSTYLELDSDAPVMSTVYVSDLIQVDLGLHRRPVGVEFLVRPAEITETMFKQLANRFPDLVARIDTRVWHTEIH